ncbi:MAG: hypothetical protein CM15mP46_5610 [Alphaproteobacteria bacterium]|nr:MAG: hypothetical protein CM15mP46_5610 [Alphaproteobacteria bacterium]
MVLKSNKRMVGCSTEMARLGSDLPLMVIVLSLGGWPLKKRPGFCPQNSCRWHSIGRDHHAALGSGKFLENYVPLARAVTGLFWVLMRGESRCSLTFSP